MKQTILAFATTKWHVLGLKAWLRRAMSKKGPQRGELHIRKHSVTGFTVDIDKNCCPEHSIQIYAVVRPKSILVKAYAVTRFVFVAILLPLRQRIGTRPSALLIFSTINTPWTLVINRVGALRVLCRGVNIYRLDEGFSSYIPSSMWKEKIRNEFAANNLGLDLLSLDYLFRKLDDTLGVDDLRLFSLNSASKCLEAKPDNVQLYRDLLRSECREEFPDSEILLPNSPRAVFLTQPLSESGEIDLNAELVVVKRAINSLMRQGYNVVVKTHPREMPEKYHVIENDEQYGGVLVLEMPISAETLFSTLGRGDIVVGVYSTGLLSASVFFDIPAFTLPSEWLSQIGAPTQLREMHSLFTTYSGNYVLPLSA